jgi:hypothetical protein
MLPLVNTLSSRRNHTLHVQIIHPLRAKQQTVLLYSQFKCLIINYNLEKGDMKSEKKNRDVLCHNVQKIFPKYGTKKGFCVIISTSDMKSSY